MRKAEGLSAAAAERRAGMRLPRRCECGGRMAYDVSLGRVWSWCMRCTPVVRCGPVPRRRDKGVRPVVPIIGRLGRSWGPSPPPRDRARRGRDT